MTRKINGGGRKRGRVQTEFEYAKNGRKYLVRGELELGAPLKAYLTEIREVGTWNSVGANGGAARVVYRQIDDFPIKTNSIIRNLDEVQHVIRRAGDGVLSCVERDVVKIDRPMAWRRSAAALVVSVTVAVFSGMTDVGSEMLGKLVGSAFWEIWTRM